jgi:hypothetical protein
MNVRKKINKMTEIHNVSQNFCMLLETKGNKMATYILHF